MLVHISLDSRLPTHVSVLPSDALTRYHLARLTDQRFGEPGRYLCVCKPPGGKKNVAGHVKRNR